MKKRSFARAIIMMLVGAIILVVAVVMFMGRPKSTNRPAVTTVPVVTETQKPTETVKPTATPEPLRYPGSEVKPSYSQIIKVAGGFEVKVDVQVWEPVKFDAEYPHPANTSRIMVNPEKKTVKDACYVVPFRILLENTTRGFGAATTNVGIGLQSESILDYSVGMYYSIENGAGYLSSSYSNNWSVYNYLVENRSARVLCMNWWGGDLKKDGEFARGSVKLDEGKIVEWSGYFIIIDSQKTPNKPNGSELLSAIFVGLNSNSPDDTLKEMLNNAVFSVEQVVKLDKDSRGELVFVD